MMEPELYTEDFEMVKVLDDYISLLWTERYNKCGSFEYEAAMTKELAGSMIPGRYLLLGGSPVAMIIETVKIVTDASEGNVLTVTGRDLTSILDRRIVWNQTDLNSKIEVAVERLLNENVINPDISVRKIPGFVFQKSGDTRLDSIKVDKQFTGDNLLEAIQTLCATNNVGFEVRLNPDNPESRFVFRLYFGEDRSYDQEENPWVIFSPSFDNLIGSNYIFSKKLVKNVVQVKGEGEGVNRKTYTIIPDGNPDGLNRRELYVDARDISQDSGEYTDDGDPIKISDEAYNEKLSARGYEKLAKYEDEKAFEGESEVVDGIFVYGRDFFMGDVVQIENEFEMTDKVRVTELIRSGDTSGFTVYPTFISTSKKEEVIGE